MAAYRSRGTKRSLASLKRGRTRGMRTLDEAAAGRDSGCLTGSDETFGFPARPGAAVRGSGESLPAGTDLGGVTILRLIGSGGMGQVYEARQHAPPRRVAVKLVRAETAACVRRRLDDEAALLGYLDHPHIARVYTVGRRVVAGHDHPWIMMELVEGGRSITEWVKDGRPELASRVALVHDAATALAAAHAKGVLHLDVKPSNLLVDRQGVLKLIDFGIGRRFDHRHHDRFQPVGRIVGTPGAMSPEQLAGRDDLIDARSDIYSLGLVLYELVVGRPPTRQPETPAAAQALLTTANENSFLLAEGKAAAQASGCSPYAAADLAAILGRCLAVDPAKRFATAWELAAELSRWQSGRLLRCRRPGRVERISRWARRHPAVTMLSVAMVLMAVTAFTVIGAFAIANSRERQRAVRAADAARVSLAGALLRQAVAAGRQHEPATVSRLLDDRQAALAAVTVPPNPGSLPANDGLAVHCLRAGLDEAVAAWNNPEGELTAVAVAAGGRLAVAGDAAGNAVMVSLRGHGLAPLGRVSLPGGRIWAAAVSQSGRLAAVAGAAGTIMLIAPERPDVPEQLDASTQRIYGLAFLPTGERLFSGGRDGVVRLWDTRERKLIRSYGPVGNSVYGVAVSPDGTTLAAAVRDGSVWLWDVDTAEPVGQLLGHQGRVFSVAFAPDGRLVASASEDQTVRLWDPASLDERRRLDHPVRVNAVRFVGNDRLVTAGGDRLLRSWQVTGQLPPRELSGHAASIWAVAVAQSGEAVLTASADGTLRRWNGRGDPQPRLQFDEPVKCLASSADGHRLAVGTVAGRLSVWNSTTGSRLAGIDTGAGPINGLCWLPGSGDLLVAADDGFVGHYRLLTDGGAAAAGGDELELVGKFSGHRRRVFAAGASVDGTAIATAGEDKTVRLWTATGEPAGLLKHPGRVFTVAFSPRGDGLLVTGCEDGLVRIVTLEGREWCRAGRHRGQVNSVCWNPEPARGWDVASAGADGQVKLWRLPGQNLTGTPSLQLVMTLTGATGKIWQIAACRHEPLVVGATDTGKVILWNTHEPSPLQVLAGHLDAAWAVALGPSEQRLFSGGWDQTVRLWGVTARDWEQKSAE